MKDNHTPHTSSDYNKEILKTIPFYNFFHSETLNLVKSIKPTVKIWLDTGCGTGLLIDQAVTEFPDCHFYLSDPSGPMLDICKEKFKTDRVEIIGEYTTMEIESPFPYEIITAIQCHHYLNFDARVKSTEHCYNMLGPYGLYVTFENIRPDSKDGIEIGLRRWGAYQASQGKNDEEIKNHQGRFDKNYFPITIVQHINILKKAGFSIVELFWMSHMQAGFYALK